MIQNYNPTVVSPVLNAQFHSQKMKQEQEQKNRGKRQQFPGLDLDLELDEEEQKLFSKIIEDIYSSSQP